MNAVLGWVKTHILIVVFGVLIVLVPPAGFVGSMFWNQRIKVSAETAYATEKQKLDSASTVTYTLPPIAPGEQPVSDRRPPNASISRAYHAERERRQAEIERVVTRAVLFNKGEARGVLVPGLFPEPADDRTERELIDRMMRAIVGAGDQPSAYASLFDSINAGTPPEPISAARAVAAYEERELDRLVGGTDQAALSEEDQQALVEGMRAQRIALYRQRAEEISVYASVDALRDATTGPQAGAPRGALPPVIPSQISQTRPTLAEAFAMQTDYWFVQDLVAAVGRANSEAGGLLTEIPRSVVKRIESIRLLPFAKVLAAASAASEDEFGGGGGGGFTDPYASSNQFTGGYQPGMQAGQNFGGGAQFGGRGGAPQAATTAAAGPTAQTHTGRASAESSVYDVRRAVMTLVVASDRLPEVVSAVSSTNFMTVTGMSVTPVDVWADLSEGYYYGPEHVVRVTLDVESAWLRQWTRDAMPTAVRDALGVVMPEPPVEEGAGDDEFADEEAQP